MKMESILWCGLVLQGHEACRLFSQDQRRHLEGAAVFSHERQPCRLNYHVICDDAWRALSAEIDGWLGNTTVDVTIDADPRRRWRLNGVAQPAVDGCMDIDLNFSPSTNLLAIRRLKLAVGETGEVKAAWLRFPSFQLEPLVQHYRRLDETTYRYESAGGRFVAHLQVNPSGFVLDYPGIWRSEVTSGP
jgi:hypothetical protein